LSEGADARRRRSHARRGEVRPHSPIVHPEPRPAGARGDRRARASVRRARERAETAGEPHGRHSPPREARVAQPERRAGKARAGAGLLVIPLLSSSGAQGDARAAIAAAYARADAAYVAARTIADLEAIREWLDTPDCTYADFDQTPRRWTDMRTYAAEGLRTP